MKYPTRQCAPTRVNWIQLRSPISHGTRISHFSQNRPKLSARASRDPAPLASGFDAIEAYRGGIGRSPTALRLRGIVTVTGGVHRVGEVEPRFMRRQPQRAAASALKIRSVDR